MQLKLIELLQMLGTDDLNESESAYLRAMKSRKWLILLSTILIIVSSGAYNSQAFERLFQVFSLSNIALFNTALFSTLFLLVRYVTHCSQVASTYGMALRARLFDKHEKFLDDIRFRLSEAELDQMDIERQLQRSDLIQDSHELSVREEKSKRLVVNLRQELINAELRDPQRNRTYTALEIFGDITALAPAGLIASIAIFGALFPSELSSLISNYGLPVTPALQKENA